MKVATEAAEISDALAAADESVRPLLEAVDIEDLAKHNVGYMAYQHKRFDWFVAAERARFQRVAELVSEAKPAGSTVVDLGCFIPHLPIALSRLGYRVAVVERFELYGPSFRHELERLAAREGLDVVDLDLATESFERLGRQDVVLLMAVLEHLNGSPADLMHRILQILDPEGMLVVDVPNIVELEKRLAFLRGKSPLPAYRQYLESAYPFSGHNREMTMDELRELLDATGYVVDRLEAYDYRPGRALSSRTRFFRHAKRLLPMSFREVILASAHARRVSP